jgi:hypothetical protein
MGRRSLRGNLEQKHVLSNGVRVLLGGSRTCTRFGGVLGRCRPQFEVPGLGHLALHRAMLFKGHPTRTALEIARRWEGRRLANAFTTKGHTCFYARVLAVRSPPPRRALRTSAAPAGSQGASRAPGRPRRDQDVRDTPDGLVQDLFNVAFWGDHPLGRRRRQPRHHARREPRAGAGLHGALLHPGSPDHLAGGLLRRPPGARAARGQRGHAAAARARTADGTGGPPRREGEVQGHRAGAPGAGHRGVDLEPGSLRGQPAGRDHREEDEQPAVPGSRSAA